MLVQYDVINIALVCVCYFPPRNRILGLCHIRECISNIYINTHNIIHTRYSWPGTDPFIYRALLIPLIEYGLRFKTRDPRRIRRRRHGEPFWRPTSRGKRLCDLFLDIFFFFFFTRITYYVYILYILCACV